MGRVHRCDKNGLKKGPWTPEEDQKLVDYIQKNGYGKWRTLPKNAGLERCGKSCRLRWTNYLRPDIKRGWFCFEEERTIIHLHSVLGNKWSAIAAHLPGRTDNEIKNYWNTRIRKKLLHMGIDPVTHSPHLDLLDLSSILINSYPKMNLSRLLGLQQPPFLNPELLSLATSLSSSHPQNPNFLHQNVYQDDHQNQISSAQMQNPFPPLSQPNPVQDPVQEIPNVEPFLSNFGSFFGSQNCQPNEWETNGNCSILGSNLVEDCDYVKLPISHCYYGSDQSFMDQPPPPPPSENSAFQASCHSNNFSFASVLSTLSTLSSSPAALDSISNFCDGGSATAAAENERESYCSNTVLNFEIPDLLDVNEFMSRF